VGAEVCHLGQTDLPLAAARALAGGRLALGVSTHSLAQALAAAAGGADYLGFGPVYPTSGKVDPDPVVGVAALAEVCAAVRLPVVAIGGLTVERAAEVALAGAAAAAAIGAMLNAGDPIAAGRAIGAAF
jgi:thiamine-phosphate diphosphorylase